VRTPRMATEGTELPVPQNEGERDIVVTFERLIRPEEEAYRYRLQAPVFTGLEDVEQFIQEFSKVTAITQWPPE